MTVYTVGFYFNASATRVALVKKARPAWQAGLLNGVGGKAEDADGGVWSVTQAREFREETDGTIVTWPSDWQKFGTVRSPGGGWDMHLFRAYDRREVVPIRGLPDEPVAMYDVEEFHKYPCVDNLRWLVYLALDRDPRLDVNVIYRPRE